MKVIPIFGMRPGETVGAQIGELHVDPEWGSLLDVEGAVFRGEDVGPTGIGIHIQSYTVDPSRVPKKV